VLERDMWQGGDVLALYERRASYARVPVRGKPRAPDEVSTLLPDAPPEAPALDTASGALSVPASAPREPPEPAVPQAASAQGVPPAGPEVPRAADEAPAAARAREAARPAARSRRVLLAAGVVLVLGLGPWLAMRPPPPAAVRTASPVETPRASLPEEFLPISLEPGGQEVASPWKRPEGDGGAVPHGAATPAPVARATPPQEKHVKTPAKAPPPPKKTGSPATQVGAAVLGCALATGCPSPATTAPVRPTPPLPPPAECPPGAQESMKELGLLYRSSEGGVHIRGGDRLIPVRPGPVTWRLTHADYWGRLPEGTLFSGEAVFGGELVQGRFTQAHTPEGKSYPVCLEVFSDGQWGWRKWKGSGQDTAIILNSGRLRPVERFGEAWRYETQPEW
jgi:serine/threonine-protein kinase